MNETVALAPPKLQPRRSSAVWAMILIGLGLGGAAVLYAINPADHMVYPKCLLYETTGLLCPGCRGLRATHQLLHGNLAAAWVLNPLAVLLVPLYAWFGLHAALIAVRGRGLAKSSPRPAFFWLGLTGLLVFAVLRNLAAR